MSDDAHEDVTTPTDDESVEETEAAKPVAESRVPKRRLDQEIQKRRAAEERLSEITARIEELETRDASELEKAQRELAKLQDSLKATQAEKAQFEANLRKQERSALIRSAAEQAGFLDADVAIALADLDKIEDSDDAASFVADTLKRKPHLAKQTEAEKPELRKVFGADATDKSGSVPEPAAPESREALHNRIYGTGGKGPFDLETARNHGGGAFAIGPDAG